MGLIRLIPPPAYYKAAPGNMYSINVKAIAGSSAGEERGQAVRVPGVSESLTYNFLALGKNLTLKKEEGDRSFWCP